MRDEGRESAGVRREVGSGRRGPTRSLVAVLVFAGLSTVLSCTDVPTAVAPAGAIELAEPWPTAEPSTVSIDAGALAAAAEQAGRIDALRSLLVVRRGRLVLERYLGGTQATDAVDVRSVTKSVVSILAGIALEQGELDRLSQPISELLAPAEVGLRPEHGAITVGHLLTMTGGFAWSEGGADVATYNAWVSASDPVDFLLNRELESVPGTEFQYNSAAVHLLGRVLEAATGESLPDYADRVLFGPLGIVTRAWEPLGPGAVNGGSGLDLRPRDLAKLGQLMLQRGWSGHRPLVPEPWVEASTRRRFEWTVAAGPMARVSYGMLWWLDLDREAFFAEGFRGQFVYVVPGLDLVVVASCDRRPEAAPSMTPVELRDAVARLLVDDVLGAVR